MKACCMILMVAASAGPSSGQTANAELEVVSVKPNRSMQASSGNRFAPTRMAWTNASLQRLIQTAYDIKPHQIAGGPGWLDSERWDVEATITGPTTSDQKYQLLQKVLESRFQLRFHWDTQMAPAYRLVVAKGGPKFKEADHARPGAPSRGGAIVSQGKIESSQISMSSFTYFLSMQTQRPVVDGTGLAGEYQLKLQWDQDVRASSDHSPPEVGGVGTLFSALPEQLGLKLEAAKAPIKILAIDHVARAAEN